MFVHPGRWRLTIELEQGDFGDMENFHALITTPGHHPIHAFSLADGLIDAHTVSWVFERDELIFALSIELHVASVSSPVQIRMPVRLQAL
jgi:hypothetical protein